MRILAYVCACMFLLDSGTTRLEKMTAGTFLYNEFSKVVVVKGKFQEPVDTRPNVRPFVCPSDNLWFSRTSKLKGHIGAVQAHLPRRMSAEDICVDVRMITFQIAL
uniref:Bm8622 n=1 Tax=Brugia malayi TaxID=6279 RepID=A0A0J9Y8M6_BRUMA|nr:Bm8622 [Brugia malayi]